MRLLVSVRDAAEARAALAGGADVIDAKDPSAGALGAVGPAALAAIVAAVGRARPVSAALGDLGDDDPAILAARGEGYTRAGATFVKVGVGRVSGGAGASGVASLGERVASAGGALILAAYADAGENGWPSVDYVLTLACRLRVAGVLMDTADKEGPGLLDHVRPEELGRWVARAHDAGLLVALAGRLAPADLGRVRGLGADLVGVRGAACAGGREGRVERARVAALAELARAGGGAEPPLSLRDDRARAAARPG